MKIEDNKIYNIFINDFKALNELLLHIGFKRVHDFKYSLHLNSNEYYIYISLNDINGQIDFTKVENNLRRNHRFLILDNMYADETIVSFIQMIKNKFNSELRKKKIDKLIK